MERGESEAVIHIDSSSSDCAEEYSSSKTRLASVVVEIPELVLPDFFDSVPRRHRSKRKVVKRYPNTFPKPELPRSNVNKRKSVVVPKQCRKLGSTMFEDYFEKLWSKFSEEKKNSFTYLGCLWFDLFRKEEFKNKVLTWIKKKHIFSKKYVFIPIVCWGHWNLLILCHFGESVECENRTRCMLLLDSLEMANPKRLEPYIRKFVLDIYKEEGRPELKKEIQKIPLLVPKVPQQRNSEDCGFFVLYFIDLFMESAPDNFNLNDGYPYFMNENWFTHEGVESFCKQVTLFCSKMKGSG